MSIRLVAAAKGLVVGLVTLIFSVVGAYFYGMWMSGGCAGFGENLECDAGLSGLGVWFDGVVVVFAVMLVVGPLLAQGFLLPLPALYVIPPFLAAFVEILVQLQQVVVLALPSKFLFFAAPFAAYPVIAAFSTPGRAAAVAPSPGSPGSP